MEGQQQHTGHDRVADAHHQRDRRAFFDAVVLARAVVLAGEGRQRHAKAEHRQDIEAVDLHVSREARHRLGAELVDRRLHKDVRKGDDHVLNTGRQADAHDAGGDFRVNAQLRGLDAVDGRDAHEVRQRQQAGQRLTDVGRQRRALHTHAQHRDENDVQHDIRARRDTEVQQRPPRVARRIQHAGRHVVQHVEDQPQRVDAQVGRRIGQHVRGRAHPLQKRPAEKEAHQRDDDAHERRDRDGGVNSLFDTGVVFRAQKLRYNDACADGHALTEPDNQVDERRAGADRRQRPAAHRVADDDRVDGVVHLLQQIAEDERDGKEQDLFQNITLRHQICVDLPPLRRCLWLCVRHTSHLPARDPR